MSLKYPLVDISEDSKNSKFLTPISKIQGSSTTAFYSISEPNKEFRKYKHNNCDIISILLRGSGVLGIGEHSVYARPGTCGLVHRGTEHFFANTSHETCVMVGFCVGAEDIEATGLQIMGSRNTKELDYDNENDQLESPEGVIVNIDNVTPEQMDENDGWEITDFRLPISAKNKSSSTLFRARFMPGAVHKKHCHKNCDEIYYIISGHGLAGVGSDRVEVHGGHFHFIPKGVEHWLFNLSQSDPIEVVGLYCEAGSVNDTGYFYMGDVTSKDLEERTT